MKHFVFKPHRMLRVTLSLIYGLRLLLNNVKLIELRNGNSSFRVYSNFYIIFSFMTILLNHYHEKEVTILV